MNILIIISTTVCVALFILYILMKVFFGNRTGVIFKTLASASFCIFGIIFLNHSKIDVYYARLISTSLIFGMLGDMFLGIKLIFEHEKRWLNLGFSSFAVQHILLIIAGMTAVTRSGHNPYLAMAIAIAPAAIFVALNSLVLKKQFNYGSFLWQTNGYSGILIMATALYIYLYILSGAMLSMAIALPLFLLSDLILCFMYFGKLKKSIIGFAANHIFYYSAQILIMLTIIL